MAELAIEEPLPTPPAKEAPAVDVFADVDMDFSAAFEEQFDRTQRVGPVEAKAAGAATAPEQTVVTPIAEAKPEKPARAASGEVDMALEDELSALLEQETQSPAQPSTAGPSVAAPSAPAVVDRPRGNFLSDPRWAALEAGEEDEFVIAVFVS